jgi:3-oxoadipate enol-lactonase
MRVRSGDTDIRYEVRGNGPDLILLHPFPANRHIWMPIADMMVERFRVIIPDLRGLGLSAPGDGPATMEKHANDLMRVCRDVGVQRAVFGGNSIGGYILFEFWRRFRERVAGLILVDTKAGADTEEARKSRLASAEDVLKRGTEPFIDAQLPNLLGATTCRNRPDRVQQAKKMMMQASAAGIAAVQRGMAERPDSTDTLASIDVPALVLSGEEDTLTPYSEMERIHKGIRGSLLRRIPQAGHYAPFEQPGEVHKVIREMVKR